MELMRFIRVTVFLFLFHAITGQIWKLRFKVLFPSTQTL
uniref:Uncharacterized protein n=1 Tax=Rhizophora mucronata TaxID=61149 RepID=A0A2P2P1G4_RHIMU